MPTYEDPDMHACMPARLLLYRHAYFAYTYSKHVPLHAQTHAYIEREKGRVGEREGKRSGREGEKE